MPHDPTLIYLKNHSPLPDRISPYAQANTLSRPARAGAYHDRFFGNWWDFRIAEGDALYGVTSYLPQAPLEELGTGQFSRVPFRRIPRIKVPSLDRLMDFVSGAIPRLNEMTTMWRGQPREYPLPRRLTDKLKLYGDADASEPSLLPSASRGTLRFEDYMAAWLGLIDVFIDKRLETLEATDAPSTITRLKEEVAAWRSSYNFKLWAFAAAQHYGLPSTGLDLTSNPEVALFFALHRLKRGAGGKTVIQRAGETDRPVIYFLGVHDSDLLPDNDLAPAWIQTSRPKAQNAFFFGTAWGEASNRAAERIVLILELEGHARWTLPDYRARFFPRVANDPFCAFLIDAATRFPDIAATVPLQQVYFLA
jgi:hypothetical protein